MTAPRQMTRHASRLCVAAGGVFVLASACEQIRENEVPERVWDAAVAVCEKWKECGRLDSTTGVQECADKWTKYFPWDDYTGECIEAWIAWFECSAAQCSSGLGACDLEFVGALRSYHCWRYDTVDCGVMCGDPTSSEWEDCDRLVGAVYGASAYLPRLCSEQTPEYCICGRHEQCAYGEYCCSSSSCEES